MYDYIKGEYKAAGTDYVVVENNGIGYKIMTSTHTIQTLHGTSHVTLFTELIVREDYMGLCGFSSRDELKAYQMLTSISGIGPKVAIGVLSKVPYLDLTRMIMTGDVKSLQKAPGIGAKTAQRIVLELKDKLSKSLDLLPLEIVAQTEHLYDDTLTDAMDAMVSLGYKKTDVEKIFTRLETKDISVEDLVKQALKLIALS